MDYLMHPEKGAIEKKRHWFKREDPLLDQINDVDAMLAVTRPGTNEYKSLLDQRAELENIRKTRKEIRILGFTPKDAFKGVTTVLVTGGLWVLGYLLDVDSPKALKHAERMSKVSERLSRDD